MDIWYSTEVKWFSLKMVGAYQKFWQNDVKLRCQSQTIVRDVHKRIYISDFCRSNPNSRSHIKYIDHTFKTNNGLQLKFKNFCLSPTEHESRSSNIHGPAHRNSPRNLLRPPLLAPQKLHRLSSPCTASHSHRGPLIPLSQTNHQLQLSIDTWFSNLAPLIKIKNGWLSKVEEPSFGIMNRVLTMLLSSDQLPFARVMNMGDGDGAVL